MNPSELTEKLYTFSQKELITYCMEKSFIPREQCCRKCTSPMHFVAYKRNIDEYAWRCMQRDCSSYKKYFSIRLNSFFDGFRIPIKKILMIILCYSVRQSLHSIKRLLDYDKKTIEMILTKLKLKMATDFSNDKLGGPGKIVQIDETMLNYKCKSHRGRSPTNRTDSLCIVECMNGIQRAYAQVIPNKQKTTIVPIIIRQVAALSIIYTDEHCSYKCLNQFDFIHFSVCHKYEFVNSTNGVHTQSIESFHNELKLEIKRRKGVETGKRELFLKEFCFYFNHRRDFFISVFNLIKI